MLHRQTKIIKIFFILVCISALAACGNTGSVPSEVTEADRIDPSASTSNEPCLHEVWKNGICQNCSLACKHPAFENGLCVQCVEPCTHRAHDPDTQLCLDCGEKQCHHFVEGYCECGAQPDLLTEPLPYDYFDPCEERGTIEVLSYVTPYYPDEKRGPMEKELMVYVPYGYDESQKYNVLILMHGAGGDMGSWFMVQTLYDFSYVHPLPKAMFDRMFMDKVAEPTILVGISTHCSDNVKQITESYAEQLGPELRNEILPLIVDTYSTYAEDSSPESISAARAHFGLGGFSNGAMYVYNPGILEDCDLFGSFMALSGSNYTVDVAEQLQNGKWADMPIYYYYAGAGTFDNRLEKTIYIYNYEIENVDRLVEGKNAMLHLIRGAHQYCVWYASAYNALQLMFPVKE